MWLSTCFAMYVTRFAFRFPKGRFRFVCLSCFVLRGNVEDDSGFAWSSGGFFADCCFLRNSGSSHLNPSGVLGNGDLGACAYVVIMPRSSRSGKHALPGVAMETTLTVGHLNKTTATLL